MGKNLKKRRITMKKVYLRPDINVATVSVFCSDVIVASGETEVFDIWVKIIHSIINIVEKSFLSN